jgi:hypothetical protein
VIGKHRLICGDCRDRNVVDRLLDGARANLVITSPPHAAQREYDASSGFTPIPPEQNSVWFRTVADNIAAILARDGSYFLNIKEHSEEGERSLYVRISLSRTNGRGAGASLTSSAGGIQRTACRANGPIV